MLMQKNGEGDTQHFSHEHPLFLKAEAHKIDDGADHSDMQMACCRTPNSGPFYSCEECGYFLHKVCAELPTEMNHPMHLQHPLTLHSKSAYPERCFKCNMCKLDGEQFVYHCSICLYDVDTICASASHTIEDKCHQHPLTPLQRPIFFCCHFCRIEEKGLSYKCNICPFWIHQNCTILLSTVKHSHHKHLLTLLQSVPYEYSDFADYCDICHDPLCSFHCVYSCVQCLFFAHVSCGGSESTPSSSFIRDQDAEISQGLLPDGNLSLLPLQEHSTDLISWFVDNYNDRDTTINSQIDHFDHKHLLFLIDGQIEEKICQACATLITTPSYGCRECDYFLHKFCTELPKQILHPFHPEHKPDLFPPRGIFFCMCCYQWCNGFHYKCLYCEQYDSIDIKCASLIKPLYHQAHKHPLNPILMSSEEACCACRLLSECFLQCDTCRFKLCLECAMTAPIIMHRWDQHPFVLTYSPLESHYNEYYCILCEDFLDPKCWFYYCHLCDQFAHIPCMRRHSAKSNIMFGKSYEYEDHSHDLTLTDCTYNNSTCHYCRYPLKMDFSVGLECKPCNFSIHLKCLESLRD